MKKHFIISIIISLTLLISLIVLVLLPSPFNYLIAFAAVIAGTLIIDILDDTK